MTRFAWTVILLGLAIGTTPLVAYLLDAGFPWAFYYPWYGMALVQMGCVLLAGAWIALAVRQRPSAAEAPEEAQARGPRGSTIRAIAMPILLIGFAFLFGHAISVANWSVGEPDWVVMVIHVLGTHDAWLTGGFILLATSFIVDAIRSRPRP